MRIAYDYGMGPRVPGMHPKTPGTDTETERVLVVKLHDEANAGESERAGESHMESPQSCGMSREGLRVAGTDYVLTTSDSAAMRDAEIRAHERAHLYALGSAAASGIILHTRTGVDGESYAVGGAVKADLSEVPGDPRSTLAKAQKVIRAAYAPGNPSTADMRVAADAYRMASQAKSELREAEWYA